MERRILFAGLLLIVFSVCIAIVLVTRQRKLYVCMPSTNSLNALGNPITREEAIEISRNSGLVKEGVATTERASIDPTHYNSSMVEQLKAGHNRELYERVPVGHSIWKVVWYFSYRIGSSSGYNVIVIVDAETCIMIHEKKGVIFA